MKGPVEVADLYINGPSLSVAVICPPAPRVPELGPGEGSLEGIGGWVF